MRIFMIILCFPFILSAQNFDFGLGVGAALYNGDLTVNSATYIQQHTHPAIALNGAYHVNDILAFRIGMMTTKLSANDAISSEAWQLNRNLNFSSMIYEFSLRGEVNLWTLFDRQKKRGMPYIYAGASAFKFNPKTEYNGQYIELQPLGTEGQGMPGYDAKYDLNAFTVLFGFGYKYELQNGFVISSSFGWRRASTDYLDDISKNYISNEELFAQNGLLSANLGNKIGKSTGSQRGGVHSNDWFNVAMVSVNYLINNEGRRRYVGSRKSRVGCPSSF